MRTLSPSPRSTLIWKGCLIRVLPPSYLLLNIVLTLLVDLNTVSSVVSNVSASDSSSASTIKSLKQESSSSSSTKITIHGYSSAPNRPQTASSSKQPSRSRSASNPNADGAASDTPNGTSTSTSPLTDEKEVVLLTLHPQSHSIASEWLDGLLLLLNQQPITSETNKMINLLSDYGLKIRLLNVRFDDATFLGECPDVPSREGLDEEYYYDVFGGA